MDDAPVIHRNNHSTTVLAAYSSSSPGQAVTYNKAPIFQQLVHSTHGIDYRVAQNASNSSEKAAHEI
jgi:hypothetical protein